MTIWQRDKQKWLFVTLSRKIVRIQQSLKKHHLTSWQSGFVTLSQVLRTKFFWQNISWQTDSHRSNRVRFYWCIFFWYFICFLSVLFFCHVVKSSWQFFVTKMVLSREIFFVTKFRDNFLENFVRLSQIFVKISI